MRIASSSVMFAATAAHQFIRTEKQTLRIQTTPPPRPPDPPKMMAASTSVTNTGDVSVDDVPMDARTRMLKLLVEYLVGHKIRLLKMGTSAANTSPAVVATAPVVVATPQPAPAQAGWSLDYELTQTAITLDSTTFQAKGVVLTDDGRQAAFSLSFQLQSEQISVQDVHVHAGDPAVVDPLVLSLDGRPAGVSNARMQFDLDADGVTDTISALPDGAAFLALDRNKDGKIGDGRELFGPTSGNGFAELAAYDTDGNGWIDENDPVFDQLKVWSGGDQLRSLKDVGVGAIYVRSAATPFDLADASGNLRARLTASSVYLKETGQAALIQEVDFVV